MRKAVRRVSESTGTVSVVKRNVESSSKRYCGEELRKELLSMDYFSSREFCAKALEIMLFSWIPAFSE